VITGSGARAIVQLADGSAVKFGENVNVAVNAMKQEKNGSFTAALDVLRGAFRLTHRYFS
jgi:ribosomal protein L14